MRFTAALGAADEGREGLVHVDEEQVVCVAGVWSCLIVAGVRVEGADLIAEHGVLFKYL